jgi:hypothetical protein
VGEGNSRNTYMHVFEESDSGRRTNELLEQWRETVGGE